MGTRILQTDLARDALYTKVNQIADEKQDTLTFDDAPANNSDNPVKSGGVYTALSGKQDTLTFDNAPTNNSDNPVKSGGVYTALTYKADDNSVPHLTGNETIAGTYTFSSSPIVPTPSVSDNSQNPVTTAYINLKFQVVTSLPESPDANTFYFIKE